VRIRPVLLLIALSVGCQPEAAPPQAGPASSPPDNAAPPQPTAAAEMEAPTRSDDEAAASHVGEPNLCVASCVSGAPTQAASPEEVERRCAGQCDGFAQASIPETCTAAARALLDRVENKPMPKRAPGLWSGLAKAEVHCGRADPALLELADQGHSIQWASREGSLLNGLQRDPLLERVCPAGASALEALDQEDGVPNATFLIEACPLPDVEVGPIHDDLPAAAFLAIEVVRARWKALHIDSGAHTRLLNTLTLASALEASKG